MPTAGELIAFSRERLAHYKCPTSVDFVDVLPRNATGKILKRELRRNDSARYEFASRHAAGRPARAVVPEEPVGGRLARVA